MSILVKDNFIDSIDILRAISTTTEYMSHKNTPVLVSWRGYRTWELSDLDNSTINECRRKILETASEFFGLTDYDLEIYFHMTLLEDQKTQVKKWHRDKQPYAGIIYLSPNAPPESGTTIFVDDKENAIENKYNRLVVYPGNYKHGITSYYGDSIDDCRRTITFFLNTKERVEDQIDLLRTVKSMHQRMSNS